jgi:hypothetical protein
MWGLSDTPVSILLFNPSFYGGLLDEPCGKCVSQCHMEYGLSFNTDTEKLFEIHLGHVEEAGVERGGQSGIT